MQQLRLFLVYPNPRIIRGLNEISYTTAPLILLYLLCFFIPGLIFSNILDLSYLVKHH